MSLTEKQRQILEAIIELVRRGEVPTVREIGAMVGLRSSATVQKHLENLREAGYLEVTGKSRGVRLRRGVGIPVVGRIAAGEPIESHDAGDADADDEFRLFGFEEVPVDPGVFNSGTAPGELVALRVRGDSMVGAGILDGDLVIIRRQPTVEEGEIAAVLVDGEGTLKRWQRCRGRGGRGAARVRLRPENDRFEPIEISESGHRDVRVYGKYVGLIRCR